MDTSRERAWTAVQHTRSLVSIFTLCCGSSIYMDLKHSYIKLKTNQWDFSAPRHQQVSHNTLLKMCNDKTHPPWQTCLNLEYVFNFKANAKSSWILIHYWAFDLKTITGKGYCSICHHVGFPSIIEIIGTENDWAVFKLQNRKIIGK